MELTAEQIQEYSERLARKERAYRENEAYVKGKNPEIYKELRGRDPDNRIPIPFAKMAVEDLAGYAARPGDINIYYENAVSEPEDAVSDEYNDIVRQWAEDNEDEIEISELYQKVLAHGVDYELWWTVEGTQQGLPVKPQWKRVPSKNVVIVYSNDLKPVKQAALYFRSYEDKEVCDVYYPLYSTHWERPKNKGWEHIAEKDAQYPYSVVPMIELTGNMDRAPVFEAEKKLCDAQDNLLSKSVNEIDRFNALIALFPGKVTKEFVDRLREMNVIDNLEEYDTWPQYLEKNLEGANEFYNQLADRLERLFHKSIKVPDFSDENFAGDSSGIALAYKLLGMEFKASMIETYFFRGLRERKRLIDDVIRAGTKALPVEEYKTVIDSKRNLPVDKAGVAEIVMKLQGIVSKETLLKILPQEWVEDVNKELERLDEEGQARIDMFSGTEEE